jgi:hypothetical protein
MGGELTLVSLLMKQIRCRQSQHSDAAGLIRPEIGTKGEFSIEGILLQLYDSGYDGEGGFAL